MLQWSDKPPNPGDQEITEFEVELNTSTSTEEVCPKLSLNVINSLVASRTMRFTGSINGHPVKVLLDGRSDDNFIQPRIPKFLQLDIQPTMAFKVLVGDGNSLQVEGLINELKVKIQGCTLTFLVYLLLMAGAEIILCAAWLATLGPHIVDYRLLSLQFYCDKFCNTVWR